mmetsp:Transcript_16872/g.50458  ORF Transcript_16872/g.50458 Transcript_16872/m.50458 type:complete len:449 (+) Transcript_16872:158-1504(+)
MWRNALLSCRSVGHAIAFPLTLSSSSRSVLTVRCTLPGVRSYACTPSSENDLHGKTVLVVGSTPTAYFAGLTLQKKGFRDVKLLATRSDHLDGRQTHIIHAPHLAYFEKLGLDSTIRDAGHPIHSEKSITSDTETVLSDIKFAEPAVCITHANLKEILSRAATSQYLKVLPHSSLTAILPHQDRFLCRLSGNRVKEVVDAVVLAEDPKSKARTSVIPAAKYKPVPTSQWNAILPMPEDMNPNTVLKFWANGTRLTVTPFSETEVHVTYLKHNGGVSGQMNDGTRAAVQFGDDCRSASIKAQWKAHLPSTILHTLLDSTYFPCWIQFSGDVIMPSTIPPNTVAIGDCAHTNRLGHDDRRLALSLEEGVVLASCLSQGDSIPSALQRFLDTIQSRVLSTEEYITTHHDDSTTGRGLLKNFFAQRRRKAFGFRTFIARGEHRSWLNNTPHW